MARSVRFDCQRLEVFGQAVEAVAVIDDLVEELPEGRAYIRDQLRRAANSRKRANAGNPPTCIGNTGRSALPLGEGGGGGLV
jgi:hypothetical protein